MDIVGNLPVELAQEIFLKLSPDDIYSAWHCSKHWRYLMDDEIFWKKKCKLEDFKELEENARSVIYNNFTQHYPSYWMGVYMYCRALYSNWKNNVYKETTVLGENVYTKIIYFDDEIAILAVKGGKVLVLDSSTGNVKKIFTMNNIRNIFDIQKYEDVIVGCGCKNFKVWNIKSGECLFEYAFEELLINDFTIFKNFVAVQDHRNCLHLIDIETGKIVYKRDGVMKVGLNNDMLALANYDGDIEILTLSFTLVKVLKAESKIKSVNIVIKGNYLIHFCKYYSSQEPNFYFAFVWNVTTGKLVQKFTPIFHYKTWIFLQEDKLIYCTVGDEDEEIFKYCNFITGEHFTIYNNSTRHSAANTKFMLFNSTVDSTLNKWCLKTGNIVAERNMENFGKFMMTERKLAYCTRNMALHILNYEHDLKY